MRIYKEVTKYDCDKLGLRYSVLERQIFIGEGNKYILRRSVSETGAVLLIVIAIPLLIAHIIRGMCDGAIEWFRAMHRVFTEVDRQEFWGEADPIVQYFVEFKK